MAESYQIFRFSNNNILTTLPPIKKMIAINNNEIILIDKCSNFHIAEIHSNNNIDSFLRHNPLHLRICTFNDLFAKLKRYEYFNRLKAKPIKYSFIDKIQNEQFLVKYDNSDIFILNPIYFQLYDIIPYTKRAENIQILDSKTILYQNKDKITFLMRYKSRRQKIIEPIPKNTLLSAVKIFQSYIAIGLEGGQVIILDIRVNAIINNIPNMIQGSSFCHIFTIPTENLLLIHYEYDSLLKVWNTDDLISKYTPNITTSSTHVYGHIEYLYTKQLISSNKTHQIYIWPPNRLCKITPDYLYIYEILNNNVNTKVIYQNKHYECNGYNACFKKFNTLCIVNQDNIIITKTSYEPIELTERYINHDTIQLYEESQKHEEIIQYICNNGAYDRKKLYTQKQKLIMAFDIMLIDNITEPMLAYIVDNRGHIICYDMIKKQILTEMRFPYALNIGLLQEFSILPMGFILAISNNIMNINEKNFIVYNPVSHNVVKDNVKNEIPWNSIGVVYYIKYISNNNIMFQYEKKSSLFQQQQQQIHQHNLHPRQSEQSHQHIQTHEPHQQQQHDNNNDDNGDNNSHHDNHLRLGNPIQHLDFQQVLDPLQQNQHQQQHDIPLLPLPLPLPQQQQQQSHDYDESFNNNENKSNWLCMMNIYSSSFSDICNLRNDIIKDAQHIKDSLYMLIFKSPSTRLMILCLATKHVLLNVNASSTIYHAIPLDYQNIVIAFNSSLQHHNHDDDLFNNSNNLIEYIYIYNWKRKVFLDKIKIPGLYEFLCSYKKIIFFSYMNIHTEEESIFSNNNNNSNNDNTVNNNIQCNVNYIDFTMKMAKTCRSLPYKYTKTCRNVFKAYPQYNSIYYHDRNNSPGTLHRITILNTKLIMIKLIKTVLLSVWTNSKPNTQVNHNIQDYAIEDVIQMLMYNEKNPCLHISHHHHHHECNYSRDNHMILTSSSIIHDNIINESIYNL